MRYYPTDEGDLKEAAKLNAEPWQIEALKMNPSYNSWGPHEDYMAGGEGWAENLRFPSLDEGGLLEPDDLNEIVNFYFELNRTHIDCAVCEQTGYNPETKIIADAFYDFEDKGVKWCADITEDEREALIEAGRARPSESLVEINAAQRSGMRHDAINRWILIEARARRLGVWGKCPECSGQGYVYLDDKCRLSLVMWVIHPRKGCSRGWEIDEIKREDLHKALEMLSKAAARNAERFSRVCAEYGKEEYARYR